MANRVEPHYADWTFAPRPQSAAEARAYVAYQLGQLGMSTKRDDILICVSELATNAIRYGDPARSFRVRLEVDVAVVRIEVRDLGEGTPRVCHLCEERGNDEHGRGLIMVKGLATAWGVERHRIGKTVWCEFKTDDYADGVRAAYAEYRRVPAPPPP